MATVGSTNAPSTNTVYYDALLSTTLEQYQPKMFDNIFKSSAFLAALREYDGIERVNGGERIRRVLMYEENTTFAAYSGYDLIDTTPQDGISAAFYEWAEIGGTITISRREERQNSGEAAILDLLRQKVVQAEMSAKQIVNKQLVQGQVSSSTFVPYTNGLLPLGYFLPKVCSTDPVSGGNVGNISRSDYSWWRVCTANMADTSSDTGTKFNMACTTWKPLKVGLYRLYNYCTRGADGSPPNLVVTCQEGYENYENSLDQSKQYRDEKLVSMGFDNVKLKQATMVWDELVPDIDSGTAALTYATYFFLNTAFYKLVIDSQSDFITTPFLENQNQTAKAAKVLFMGQATVSNARKLGVGYGSTLAMTS